MFNYVDCIFLNDCATGLHDKSKCKKCANNIKRNYIGDHFIKAEDNPIPEKCPKLRYDGPAEQTMGYRCPVCGGYTNPYAMNEEHICGCCGYKLNI